MKVAILCGGRGSRIREVADVIPKPMIPIGDQPILWHIMKIYSFYGFHDFVLLLGYKGRVIRDFFLNYAAYSSDVTVDFTSKSGARITVQQTLSEPWRVTLVDTGEDAMTGARLWRARRYFEQEKSFCLTYGDGVGNIDIAELAKFHASHGKLATLTGVQPPGRFGELTLGGEKTNGAKITGFNEKPQVSGGYINGGFFIFNSQIFDRYLNSDESLVLEKSPLEKMAADEELMMFRHDGFWQPMDTPREYQLLNSLWKSGQAPWQIWKADLIRKAA